MSNNPFRSTHDTDLNTDLTKCIKFGSGTITNGVIITTRIYNATTFTSYSYCVDDSTTVNIPKGEMFYEIIKANNVLVTGYDELNGNGNQTDLLPGNVQSLVITVYPDGSSSDYNLSSSAISIILIVSIFMLILLSSSGYYAHRYYNNWNHHKTPYHMNNDNKYYDFRY